MFYRDSTYIWIPWSVCACVLGGYLFKMQTTGISGSEGWGPGLWIVNMSPWRCLYTYKFDDLSPGSFASIVSHLMTDT